MRVPTYITAALLALMFGSSAVVADATAPKSERPRFSSVSSTPSTGSIRPETQVEGLSESLMARVDVEQKMGAQLPLDLPFKDAKGNDVTLQRYFDERPVLVAMVYYECPMLCGLVLEGLIRSLRGVSFKVGEEFDVLIVSIDPGEGPELAAAKKERLINSYDRGKPEGWHLLTGSQESITALAETIGFRYAYDERRDEYAHAAMIAVATPQGKLARYFFGIEYPPKDVRLAMVEASDGKIGSIVDKLLLLCYHYDPSTGRYSMVALNAVRIGGAMTVFALAGSIFAVLRRERRA